MTEVLIGPDDPRASDVRRLLARHLEFAHTHTPAEAVFALDLDGLLAPEVRFFSARREGELLAVGAIRSTTTSTSTTAHRCLSAAGEQDARAYR